MRLLVGTVLKSASEQNKKLLQNQLWFLDQTTDSYDHVTLLNGKHELEGEFNTTVVRRRSQDRSGTSEAHLHGLRRLHGYFKEHQGDYDWFLFLDSDAFPMRKEWLKTLKKVMATHGKDIAIPIRYENLEQKIHCCIMLCRARALDEISFTFTKMGHSLTARTENDIRVVRYERDLLEKVFPLIRSNRINHHPFFSAIYYDMFYHHQGGSHEMQKKWARGRLYWNHVVPNYYAKLTEAFMNNPTAYVASLAGWNPECYPTPNTDHSMWSRDGLSFAKVGKDDLTTLLSLKVQSWHGCHTAVFLNEYDQEKWFSSMSATSPRDMVMIVRDEESGERVGAFKIFNVEWVSGRAEVGWDVFESHRRKGYGKRIVKAGFEFCFGVMNLRHLSAEILEDNFASIKCAEGAGMSRVGTRKKLVFRDDKYLDSHMYETIKENKE